MNERNDSCPPEQKKKAQEINGCIRNIIKEYRAGFPTYHDPYPNYSFKDKVSFAADRLVTIAHRAYQLADFGTMAGWEEASPIVFNTDGLSLDDAVLFDVIWRYAVAKSDSDRYYKDLMERIRAED